MFLLKKCVLNILTFPRPHSPFWVVGDDFGSSWRRSSRQREHTRHIQSHIYTNILPLGISRNLFWTSRVFKGLGFVRVRALNAKPPLEYHWFWTKSLFGFVCKTDFPMSFHSIYFDIMQYHESIWRFTFKLFISPITTPTQGGGRNLQNTVQR